jgi:hypothetical protein
MKKVSLTSLVMFPMMMSHFVFVVGLGTKDAAFKLVMELHLIAGLIYYTLILFAMMFWFLQFAIKDSDRVPAAKARTYGVVCSLKIALSILASSAGFFMAGITIGALAESNFKTVSFVMLIILFITVMSKYYAHISQVSFKPEENKLDDHSTVSILCRE